MKVNFKDNDILENEKYLEIVEDLYEGIRKVKSKKYLKQHYLEEDDTYLERLNNATLYNFFKKAVDNLSAILFRKEMILDYKVKNENFIKNVDNKGTSIKLFSKEVAKNALLDGLTYIWIDSQRIDSNINKLNADSIKPFFKNVRRKNVYSKKIDYVNGQAVLKQIVIKQVITVDKENDDFQTEEKEVYIVLRENGGQIWIEKKGKFELYDNWESNLGIVPIIPVYSAKTDYLKANIPLLDLAYLNIKHFNKESNLDSILELSALPVPVIYSNNEYDKDTLKKQGITIGVNKALSFSDKSTEGFEFSEISGTSISKLQENLSKLEEIMDKTALSILTEKSFNTATEAKIADSNSNLFLYDLALSIEEAINNAYKIAELYIDRKLDITITLNKDFDSLALDAQTIDKYIALKQNGLISIDTLWDELKKGEILNIKDYDLEKQKIIDEEVQI